MGDIGRRDRLFYIDNLRFFLILLVIVVHSGITYGAAGSWFYHDPTESSFALEAVLTIVNILIQAFFMGLLYLIAGYFVIPSLERKGAKKFIIDRLTRLGIPSLIFILILAPSMIYGLHFASEKALTDYYFGYASDIPHWDSGPMWFAIALLLFSIICVLSLRIKRWDQYKAQLDTRFILTLIALISVGSFLVRLVFPVMTSIWNMQLSFFTQYIAFFIIGVLAFRNNWLASIDRRKGTLWLKIAILSVIFMLLPALIFGGAADDNLEPYFGGLTWQAAAYAVWEQIFAVGMSLWLIVRFRERYNHQGRIARKLSRNSFTVYIFHPPVLVGISVLLAMTQIPNPLKFLLLVISVICVTYMLAEFILRKIPGLKSIL